MKKLIAMLLLLVMLSTLLVACGNPEEQKPDNTEPTTQQNAVKFEDIDLSSVVNFDLVTTSEAPTDYVLLDVASYGKILIRLYPDVAPETVANFKALVASGFYDGLTFHRIMEGFMMQGGDPEADGTGGSVDCSEVNKYTMESTLVKGLYFAGEVLDIDANTGGYNMQVAFSTGRLAGQLKK